MVQENKSLPIRRINFNLKKLTETGERSDSRWSLLQKLNFTSLIFCTLAFAGLVSLPSDQFDWLLHNVERYLQVRRLPSDWVIREQVRKVIANAPRQANTAAFLKNYHTVELELCEISNDNVQREEPPSKRRCVEWPSQFAEISLTGDVYELTIEDARAITLSDNICGKIWLTDTYGGNTTSFITIPVSDEVMN